MSVNEACGKSTLNAQKRKALISTTPFTMCNLSYCFSQHYSFRMALACGETIKANGNISITAAGRTKTKIFSLLWNITYQKSI